MASEKGIMRKAFMTSEMVLSHYRIDESGLTACLKNVVGTGVYESNYPKNKIGEVRIAPFDVQFSDEDILQPDLLFIKNEKLNLVRNKGLFGAPDLVIEVLSPSTSYLDYQEKKVIYEKFGVQEYFIVDPNTKSVSSFFLKNKEYQEQETAETIIKSIVLNTDIVF